MEKLDIFYKAYTEFKKTTVLDVETSKFQHIFMNNRGKNYEDINIIYSTVHIEEDWILAIEKGLVYLEKAIKEDRQFIRNDEEVLPIEKIRKTTSDGIRDLAKHSNYITHENDGTKDSVVIPDKMLNVQRESDYAVYENRVVYATLVYLKEFVSTRLNKIKELTNRYDSKAFIKKKIDLGSRKIDVDFSLNEIRSDDPYRERQSGAYELIHRLDNIMSGIMGLLKMPLMQEVSRHELISRPVTKTNVLRMNINFRESLACFDYVAEYSGPGYQIETFKRSLSPFSDEIEKSYSDIIMLASFITYMYSNGLGDELKSQYLKAEEERIKKENELLLQKLKNMSLTALNKGQTLEEALDAFEKGYRLLEKQNEELKNTIQEMETIHKKELQQVKDECFEKISSIQEEADSHIEQIKKECEEKMGELRNECDARLQEANEFHRQEINQLQSRFDDEINSVKEQTRQEVEAAVTPLNESLAKEKDDNSRLTESNKKLVEENGALRALVISLKKQNGQKVDTDDFIARDDFNQLEKDKECFDRFFNDAWKAAKKNIIKNTLKIDKEKKGKK